ncbi:MAG: Zn-ribbon domain-containing OB-fold protein [Pseudomonadales bacterium]|nr:Zn-ribbon domain-containing OB-fold protein [Pseudomonadales bacterium]MCP5184932.1 Zn-ribbon domain-containing OB-fold protein [Pseudomonadales bacterium]
MTDAKRPLPDAEEADTRAFWQATKAHRLSYQQCRQCNTVVFYPRAHCTGCTNGELEWKDSAGSGTVYTYSVVRQSYHPFFRGLAPYIVAWIDLDEGPRLVSNLIGVDTPDLSLIGRRVTVVWEDHETLAVPLFALA